MRKLLIGLSAGGLIAVAAAPTINAQPDDGGVPPIVVAGGQAAPKATSTAKAPKGPNPYLALVPDPSTVDYSGWKRYLARKSQERADAMAASATTAAAPILVEEDEPSGVRGSNDRPRSAQRIAGFGTGAVLNHRARVLGELSAEEVFAEEIPANTEDDGAIPLAGDTGIGTVRDGITTSAEIGDGPHGSAGSGSGDFDFYAVRARAGEAIIADIDTPSGELDSMLFVYDSSGQLVAENDDFDELDSYIVYEVRTPGTYFVSVAGFPVFQEDPFDSGSGSGVIDEIPFDEGPYNLTITAGEVDVDFYAVRLKKGDVLGSVVDGAAARIQLFDTPSHEVMGSTQDATFIYSANSPLPGGGNAVADHVADRTGVHYVAISTGDGRYEVTLEAYRPRLERAGRVQTLFLDFDGERVNTNIWGGPGIRQLSPLRAFLGRWGMNNAQLDPLIDRIIATVRENLRRDMLANGRNPNFELRILNSRDHADPFGRRDVSRIIVGGTIAESGIPTIGIAQSIDPGNFGTQESALVLLDILSDPPAGFGDPSLNSYLRPRSNRVRFVGQAVGNIVAHEAGHYFGNWHVAQFNERANLMDQGGNFPVLYGVGPDRIGGTRDDVDVDFGRDRFNPNEGFTGRENTLTRVLFGLS